MVLENSHPTDEELLLAADGELSTRRAARTRAHLTACWDCRARMAEMEGAVAAFARAHRQAGDLNLPPLAGSRERLRTRLTELAARPRSNSWRRLFPFPAAMRTAAYLCLATLAVAICGKWLFDYSLSHGRSSDATSFAFGAVPNRNLTPGATRYVAVSDVCSMAHEEVVSAVPASLRQEVLQEYGIANPDPGQYEIDYLIAPGLGGAEDIRNLWPEPYTSPIWNAHVKDALEERLHELVCSGQISLATAQHDISTDWIAAYKKYFQTEKPPSVRTDLRRRGWSKAGAPGIALPGIALVDASKSELNNKDCDSGGNLQERRNG
jgi:hypothetical protein